MSKPDAVVDRPVVVDRFEALLDDRLADLVWQYEQRWCELPASTRDWLREVLTLVLADLRRDVLALAREVVTPPRA